MVVEGLETSVVSCILVPSVRHSNWCVLGLPRTLGSIKQPLAEPQLPLCLPLPPDTCPKPAGRGGNVRAVLDHADTMEMPCGLWGWWLYTPALEASWFPGAVTLMPPWFPCQDFCTAMFQYQSGRLPQERSFPMLSPHCLTSWQVCHIGLELIMMDFTS